MSGKMRLSAGRFGRVFLQMAVLLALCLSPLLICRKAAAQTAEAYVIKFSSQTGSGFQVKNSSGRSVAIHKDMRLYSGYVLQTAAGNYVYLSLDSKKAIKLDQDTKVEIQKEGTKNVIKVLSGTIFFHVSEKLKENESFDVSTSTMSMGIRGTSGCAYAELKFEEGRNARIIEGMHIYNGLGEVESNIESNNENGSSIFLEPGYKTEVDVSRMTGGNVSFSEIHQKISLDEVPSIVFEEMKREPVLYGKITEEMPQMKEVSVEKLNELQETSLAREEKAQEEKVAYVKEVREEVQSQYRKDFFDNSGNGTGEDSDKNSGKETGTSKNAQDAAGAGSENSGTGGSSGAGSGGSFGESTGGGSGESSGGSTGGDSGAGTGGSTGGSGAGTEGSAGEGSGTGSGGNTGEGDGTGSGESSGGGSEAGLIIKQTSGKLSKEQHSTTEDSELSMELGLDGIEEELVFVWCDEEGEASSAPEGITLDGISGAKASFLITPYCAGNFYFRIKVGEVYSEVCTIEVESGFDDINLSSERMAGTLYLFGIQEDNWVYFPNADFTDDNIVWLSRDSGWQSDTKPGGFSMRREDSGTGAAKLYFELNTDEAIEEGTYYFRFLNEKSYSKVYTLEIALTKEAPAIDLDNERAKNTQVVKNVDGTISPATIPVAENITVGYLTLEKGEKGHVSTSEFTWRMSSTADKTVEIKPLDGKNPAPGEHTVYIVAYTKAAGETQEHLALLLEPITITYVVE